MRNIKIILVLLLILSSCCNDGSEKKYIQSILIKNCYGESALIEAKTSLREVHLHIENISQNSFPVLVIDDGCWGEVIAVNICDFELKSTEKIIKK